VFVNGNAQLGNSTSSRRFKDDIEDMGDASADLMELRPVIFHYKPAYDDRSHLLQYGLIAEEVAKVYPDLVQLDDQGRPQAVRYDLVNAMLLNEVQKQHRTIATQAAELEQEHARLDA
jgi:trimeric autotransporter adhesin